MRHQARNLVSIASCLLLVSFGAACALAQADKEPSIFPLATVPRVGDAIHPAEMPAKMQCAVAAAQTWPCFYGEMDGIVYRVAYKPETFGSSVVMDVRTSDRKFRTPEGLKIGDVFVATGLKDLIIQPYFAVYGNSDTDWIPVVGSIDKVCVVQEGKQDAFQPVTDLDLPPGSKVGLRISGFAQRKGIEHK